MPVITHLSLSNFRNIEAASLEPNSHLNLIVGANGAGKTSLLEAISVLAHGRSFRTSKFRRLVNQEQRSFVLFARATADSGQQHQIGIERSRAGDSRFRLNGQVARSSAELAECLPLLVMNSGSFSLLEGAPKVRRMFLDWLVFHVKHEFGECWRQAQRCIKQRNSLLRRDKIAYAEVAPWDFEIARLSIALDAMRASCFALLAKSLETLQQRADTSLQQAVHIKFFNGWPDELCTAESRAQALAQHFESDCRRGFSALGPHKAEFRVSVGRTPAAEILSRGQLKTLICALFVCEAQVFKAQRASAPIFLLDDLGAELDRRNQAQLAIWLAELGSQIFITGTDEAQLLGALPETTPQSKQVFHVKHGQVSTQDNTERSA